MTNTQTSSRFRSSQRSNLSGSLTAAQMLGLSDSACFEGTSYRLLNRLGAGTMGEVYVAEHLLLRRVLVLKVMHARYATDPVMTTRMVREARIVASLEHQSLVRMYDLGTTATGRLFIAMEHLNGQCLRTILQREGRLTVRETLDIAMQILRGLEVAHTAGVIHRDIKPENLLITANGCVKILDFGVAKLPKEDVTSELTMEGTVIGTPKYMAPEQIEGKPLSPSTDLYALACVIFECLTGKPVFDHQQCRALLLMHLIERAPSLAAAGVMSYPAELERWIERALRKAPMERFTSAREMANALKPILEQARNRACAVSCAQVESIQAVSSEIDDAPETLRSPPPISCVQSADSVHEKVARRLPRKRKTKRACSESGTLLSGRRPRLPHKKRKQSVMGQFVTATLAFFLLLGVIRITPRLVKSETAIEVVSRMRRDCA